MDRGGSFFRRRIGSIGQLAVDTFGADHNLTSCTRFERCQWPRRASTNGGVDGCCFPGSLYYTAMIDASGSTAVIFGRVGIVLNVDKLYMFGAMLVVEESLENAGIDCDRFPGRLPYECVAAIDPPGGFAVEAKCSRSLAVVGHILSGGFCNYSLPRSILGSLRLTLTLTS